MSRSALSAGAPLLWAALGTGCAPAGRDAARRDSSTTSAPVRESSAVPIVPEETAYLSDALRARLGGLPEMGWLEPSGLFLAPLPQAAGLVVFGPADFPSSVRFARLIGRDEHRSMTRQYGIACEAPDSLAAYSAPRREEPARALFARGAPPAGWRQGSVPVTLTPSHRAQVAALLGWPAEERTRPDTAVALAPGEPFFSFHARFNPARELSETALVLHDPAGRPIAVRRDGPDAYACADCEPATLDDGITRLFTPLNLFVLPGLPHPLLLLDTSTFEGRALSLVTFTPLGAPSEFRVYEYVVVCAMDMER